MTIYMPRQTGVSTRNNIFAVSAVCGGGKTQSAVEHIANNVSKRNFIYTVPTIALGKSVKARIRELNPDCKIAFIYDDGALGDVYKYFRQKRGASGHVLIVTWTCWQMAHRLHDWKTLNRYQLIIDEVPSLAGAQFFNVKKKHFNHLRVLVKPAKSTHLDAVRLVPVNAKKIEKMLKAGDIPEACQKFFRLLINGNFHMFVGGDQWEDMTSHEKLDEMDLVALLNPRPFKGAVLMGANLEQLLLYKWFSRWYDVSFNHGHPITKKVNKHHSKSLGDQVTVKFSRHKNFSKYMMQDVEGKWNHETGNLNIDDMTALIKADMKTNGLDNQGYGFTVNSDFEEQPFDTSLVTDEKAVFIPPKSHGLNHYQHLNTMVFMCAMNPTPAQQELMGKLGFTYDDLRYDMMIDPAYQWFMRSGARSRSPEGHFYFYAPDFATASAVCALTGATLDYIGGDVFPNQEPMTAQERKEKERNNKFLLEYELPVNNKNCHEVLIKQFFKGSRDKNCSLPMDHVHLGLSHDKKHALPNQIFDLTYDRATFISHMKKFAKTKTTKEKAYKLIPSWFQRDTVQTTEFRSKANVSVIHGMLLDIDGGTYSIQNFIDDFGKKFSFMIHSTATCGDDMTRFHVFLPYHKACGIEEHEAVYDWFESRLKGAKLDSASRSGVGVFTLPFTTKDGKEPFLEFFNMKRDSDLKKRIDPFEVKRLAPVKIDVTFKKSADKKELDIDELKNSVRLAEDKRNRFFTVMVKLSNAGYSEWDIRSELVPLESELSKTDWLEKGFKQILRYDKAA